MHRSEYVYTSHRFKLLGSSGSHPALSSLSSQVFSFTNPGGKYTLDLSIPYDRSLCRPVGAWVRLGLWQTLEVLPQGCPFDITGYLMKCRYFYLNVFPQLRETHSPM